MWTLWIGFSFVWFWEVTRNNFPSGINLRQSKIILFYFRWIKHSRVAPFRYRRRMLAPPLTLLTAGNSATPRGRSLNASPRKLPSTINPKVPASASRTSRTRSGMGSKACVIFMCCEVEDGGTASFLAAGYRPWLCPACHSWLVWSSQPQDWESPPTRTLYPDDCRGQSCLEIPNTAWLPLCSELHSISHTWSPLFTPSSALAPSLLRSTGDRVTSCLQEDSRKWGEWWTELQCERGSPGAAGGEFSVRARREEVGTPSRANADEEEGELRFVLLHSHADSVRPIDSLEETKKKTRLRTWLHTYTHTFTLGTI